MEMYIGYVDMIENIFEVHTYTIESENEKDYVLTRNILPHLTSTTDYKNIPKKWTNDEDGIAIDNDQNKIVFYSLDKESVIDNVWFYRHLKAEKVQKEWEFFQNTTGVNYLEH